MAKAIITIEDLPNGKVKVETNPSFEVLMKMDESGNGLTCAHGYLFSVINHIQRISKQNGPIIRQIPRLIS
jgi:hypothetical protein